jgi:hypothetical protein
MQNSPRTPETNAYLTRLKEITGQILSSDIEHVQVKAPVEQLYLLFSNIIGSAAGAGCPEDTVETLLAQGLAISPKVAADCIHDAVRTAQYLRATHAAVLAAQQRFPNQTLEILYAGCGPFAPLAIPLATQFSPGEIQFTLLDVHQRSLDTAQRIFDSLGLSAFVRAYHQGDATTYKHPAGNALHIVVTETMQSALLNEPQVSIVLNLALQLCDGGILIPESVAIDACLWDLVYKPAAPAGAMTRLHMGRVAEFTLDTCRNLSKKFGTNLSEARLLPAGSVETPDDATEDFYLTILTTITVFGQFKLSESESLLTFPIVMHDLGKIRAGMKIEFYYQLGAKPRFKCRLVSDVSEALLSGRA